MTARAAAAGAAPPFPVSLEQLLADEATRRREFPVVAERVYLAHASVCPLPACVVRALTAYLELVGRGGQFEHLHAAAESGARQIAADLLGATADEIAFVPSTSAGLSLVAGGLSWRAGDNVIVAEGDFPSNVYPWLDLQRHGVTLRSIPRRPDGVITLGDVVALTDERTRLVSLSSVHFVTGTRLDVDAIGAHLRARGVLFCVDAIQSFGALPLSTRNVDFLTADAHKWMLGPQGIGILFVRRSLFDSLHPPWLGWKSVSASKDFSRLELQFPDSARRYEPGSLNALGLTGIHAALSMLRDIGVDAIGKRLLDLRAFLAPGLAAKGYTVEGVSSPADCSGITSFRAQSEEDTMNIYRRLDQRGIVVSLRQNPFGNNCVRVAPHFYTTEADLTALLDNL